MAVKSLIGTINNNSQIIRRPRFLLEGNAPGKGSLSLIRGPAVSEAAQVVVWCWILVVHRWDCWWSVAVVWLGPFGSLSLVLRVLNGAFDILFWMNKTGLVGCKFQGGRLKIQRPLLLGQTFPKAP